MGQGVEQKAARARRPHGPSGGEVPSARAPTVSAGSSSGSLDEILQLIADRARSVIGADIALISYVRAERWSQSVTAVSLSQRYEPWREFLTLP
ncbi:MAG: hypothetical protein ACM3ZF_08715, partial [Mycobacterium leprae]